MNWQGFLNDSFRLKNLKPFWDRSPYWLWARISQQQLCTHSPIPFSLHSFAHFRNTWFSLPLSSKRYSYLSKSHYTWSFFILWPSCFLTLSTLWITQSFSVWELSTKLRQNEQAAGKHTHAYGETFPWGFASFSLFFVPDHLLEIQKSLEPVSED